MKKTENMKVAAGKAGNMKGAGRKAEAVRKMLKAACLLLCVAMTAGCEKNIVTESDGETGGEAVPAGAKTKAFTFTVKGDFGAATFTRGYLAADGQAMTDLWVYDYMNGQCVQTVHQSSSDSDWGTPGMALAYGAHHVYFVASRGDAPAVDAENHTIVWGTPRDTFWKDYEVEVVSTSNGNRAVTLDRVATKLTISIQDEVPAGCAAISVTPSRWYYGLDYMTGAAVSAQQKARTVSVPNSVAGTSGQLSVSIFGLSGSDEWVTDVAVQATDGNGAVIGSAQISGAPFKRNRSTEYSGGLFASAGGLDVSLSAGWETAKTGTW